MTLEEAGGAFVKLGQILSTRPDLLPEEVTTELARLQDLVGGGHRTPGQRSAVGATDVET